MEDKMYHSNYKLFVRHAIERNCSCENADTCLQGIEKTLETSLHGGFIGIRLFPIDGLVDTLYERVIDNPEKTVGDAADAVRVLLTYGINICRSPNRPEYKLIKTYTGFFQSKVLEKFPEYPFVLTGFGYSEGEYPDELCLRNIPKNVGEFTFDVLLTAIELRHIQNLITIATELKGTVEDAFEARRQVKNGRKWCYQDAVVHLINRKQMVRPAAVIMSPRENVLQPSAERKMPEPRQHRESAGTKDTDDAYSSYEHVAPSNVPLATQKVHYYPSVDVGYDDMDNIYKGIEDRGSSLAHFERLSLRGHSDVRPPARRPGLRPSQPGHVDNSLPFIYDKTYDRVPDIYER